MDQKKTGLWRRMLSIAKPFWFSNGRMSAIGMLVLTGGLVAGFFGMFWFIDHVGGMVETVAGFGLADWWNLVKVYSLPLLGATGLISFLLYRYSKTHENSRALVLLGLLLLLMLSVNMLNVIINFVGGAFMTALATKAEAKYWVMLYIYAGVFVAGTPIVVYYAWVRDKLILVWRKWLTNYLLDKYFSDRNYYRINAQAHIDNPDERIHQDVEAYVRQFLSIMLAVLGSIITFFSFITILYMISVKLVVFAVIYSVVGTIVITWWFGKRLARLNFEQTKLEADFRYNLIHVRNNVESIAFYRGEERESQQVESRFMDALRNFNFLIGWTRNLSFLQTGFDYFVIIIPSLIIAPLYFAGTVEMGVIQQAGLAFSQILGALALVVVEFRELASFAANTNRLSGFVEALDAPDVSEQPGRTAIEFVEEPRIAMESMTLMTPNYERMLVKDLTCEVKPGEGLVIVGPSGAGKSSILRAMAGLWKSGDGTIHRPSLEDMLFLPQRPYMILGTLREQLLYPNVNADVSDDELKKILVEVNLPDLVERVGGLDVNLNWKDVLSLGEQQRVAFARLLLAKPKYAILDEATSALDVANEEHLYTMLDESGTTFVSVGHRPTLVKYHQNRLELTGKDGGWKIESTGHAG